MPEATKRASDGWNCTQNAQDERLPYGMFRVGNQLWAQCERCSGIVEGKQTDLGEPAYLQPVAAPLCPTCRFNELRRFIMAGKWAEDRGCAHHYVIFPDAQDCQRHEREPGTDC
jgi:hypothetical protein